MGEILVKVSGLGTNPAEIARRKATIVDLARSHAALSSSVTNFSLSSITFHILFQDSSKAQEFVEACEHHKPLISIEQPPRYN